uniref:SFRICE_007402 n=1 Tax=Spodoptera frugiperda TaxID=7108 RepID=A0A2H1VVY2_SPOFR
MPLRKSEGAMDDPLKQTSKSIDKITAISKMLENKTGTTEDSKIEWSNLIFLPFQPVFQLFVLLSVIVKVLLGPIQSVYPIVYCGEVMDQTPVLLFIKYCYWYFCDALYGIDTFLHIVHRQVTDQAMRREHLPKSAGLLIIDLISLIPFLRLVMPNPCPVPRLWPNILAFNEFLVIYRVTEYFSLVTTHSYFNLLVGYSLTLCMTLNCIACFWLLLTEEGFCKHCTGVGNYYDWRAYVIYKLNETDVGYTTYVYAYTFVFSFTQNAFFDNETKPSAILEFIIVCMFLICAYILNHFIVMPKFFAESLLRLRRVCTKYSVTRKIIEETHRRNPTTNAHKEVENFYKIIWRKRSGIIHMPEVFKTEIPRYLRLEIKQDLLWPLYYHSPILRKTSFPLRRLISECVELSYRMPGERFFVGDHSKTSLYYLKSGIVQLISADDGITPIFSVTSGTIFGDINFYVPNYDRKVACQCLTYCEIYVVQRKFLIQALHKYPIDRQTVMEAVRDRLNHAKKLFNSKKSIRGLDRNEDEGIAWINRRWWEIYEVFEKVMEQTGFSREQVRCDLPREESIYHCAKYLGQLVLCTPTELQTKSMFTNVSFPWIMNPVSKFGFVWHRIVFITVMMVLCVFPPNLVKREIPSWFTFFTLYTDTIYGIDIAVSLFTAVKTEDSVTSTFSTVLFERFKSFTFMLDILSSIWLEDLAYIVGAPQYYYTFQFNRLIKIYVLFYGIYLKWDIRRNPLVDVCRKLLLINFTFIVLTSHIMFELTNYMPQLTVTYFFGEVLCSRTVKVDCVEMNPVTGVLINWAFEWTFCEYVAMNLWDTYVGIVISFLSYLIFVYCRSTLVSYMYLESRVLSSYRRFVSNLKKYYQHYSIHVDLLRRLDRYFICHWKYYQGHDVISSNSMIEEPIEIYWKAQGEVAQRIISKSITFTHADPSLIKELACMARFLVLPKNTIIFMFGNQVKNVTWIVQGFVKVESHDEKGEIVETYYGPGTLLSIAAVYFGKESTIYIPINIFYDIYKKYTLEYEYLQNCVKEFTPMVDEMFRNYLLHRRDYQQKLRDRINSTRMSMTSTAKVIPELQQNRSLPFEGDFWGDPESAFMQTWLMFRTVVVYVSISSAAVLGGIGAVSRWVFTMISAFCDCIAWIDIILKLFLAYHDDRGIIITNTKKCFVNYITKAFILDLIGVIPVYEVLKALLSAEIDDDTSFLINTVCKFAHIYILFAYFQYISDLPTVNGTLINIVKWQLVNSLLVLGASHYFMVVCVKFEFNERNMDLLSVTLRDTCWMPDVMTMPFNLSWNDLHLIFAESLSLAENGMMGLNYGRFLVDSRNLGVGLCLFVIGFIFWCISCHALTLLVLDARGDFLFQHAVNQLDRFLTSERVEDSIIQKAMQHFRYCWVRTKGIQLNQLTNEGIGVVFRQDLNYFFYKKTFSILDTIIKGGEAMQRQLASVSTQAFFLGGHDIIRENDLVTYLCVVHRGKVVLTKKNRKLIVLTKGDIFGQLLGTRKRPIRVTATAEDKVDVLYIEINAFQSIITEEVRRTIMRNPQHKNDFLATKYVTLENPYDTVKYLLRGRKMIKLPWNDFPVEGYHGTWYSNFLHLTWFVGPFITTVCVNSFVVLPTGHNLWYRVYIVLFICDVIHLANFIADFYSIQLVVVQNKCQHQRVGWKKLKDWSLYLDILSFLIPLGTIFHNDWRYQYARMLRLKYFFDYDFHFCRGFKRSMAPILLKIAIFLLVIHCFTCGWVYIACRRKGKFPIHIRDMRDMVNTIDFSQWTHPDDRGEGCARATRDIRDEEDPAVFIPTFVVPKYWPYDYIVALTYILLIHTHTNIDTIMPLSINEVYYKVFTTFVLQLLDIYIMALAINAAYTKYRELYQYNFSIKNMLIYLTDSGLSRSLSDNVWAYTVQLWKRQKGDKLPDLAYQCPPCLRQDLFTALYLHHLDAPPTFRMLPDYFKRQLAARLQRTVIFPGKCIVREGDTFNITYFIHEGEVEKWYIDKAGENKLMSVLYTNGYFGCMSGLFVNVGFHFTYYSRTVVDLVYLDLDKWTDLLTSYPDIKAKLYEATRNMKKDHTKKK